MLIGKIENNHCALAITEVRSSQGKELFLPLSVPYLQPHRLLFDHKCQTLQVHPNCVHLALIVEVIINKSDQ